MELSPKKEALPKLFPREDMKKNEEAKWKKMQTSVDSWSECACFIMWRKFLTAVYSAESFLASA